MARRAARTDANQRTIVAGLRAVPGVTVRVTSAVGDGFPDIVVGHRERNYLFEIKNPSVSPSDRELTPLEREFFETWHGQVNVIETLDDALSLLPLDEDTEIQQCEACGTFCDFDDLREVNDGWPRAAEPEGSPYYGTGATILICQQCYEEKGGL